MTASASGVFPIYTIVKKALILLFSRQLYQTACPCLDGTHFVLVVDVSSLVQDAVGGLDVTLHGCKVESRVAVVVGQVHGLLHFGQQGDAALVAALNSLQRNRAENVHHTLARIRSLTAN